MAKSPKTPRARSVAALDKAFSIWVRKSGADHTGRACCYTCGKVQQWREMDAGHFRSRVHHATRWDEQNVKPQCKFCNGPRGGEQYLFGVALDREYGEGTADRLTAKSKTTRKFTTAELDELTEYYRRRIREMGE